MNLLISRGFPGKRILLTFLYLFLFTGSHTVFSAELLDRVLVEIQNQVITELELNFQIDQEQKQRQLMNRPPLDKNTALTEVLKRLIDDSLIILESENLGIKISQEELNSQLENFKARNNLNGATFEELLKNQNTTPLDFKRYLIKEIKKSQLIGYKVRAEVDVTDEDVRRAYDNKYKKALKYKIRHILRKLPAGSGPDVEKKTAEELKYISGELKPDRSNFSELALKYSDDPGVETNKGELNSFLPEDVFDELGYAVKSMKKGDIVTGVKTPLGIHIIELLDIEEGESQELADVENKIREDLYQKDFETRYIRFMIELRQKYQIKFRDDRIAEIYNNSLTENPS